MSYIFQKRLARGQQVPDPDDFNQDFVPPAEKISGRLNAHDFDASDMKANATAAGDAYYKPYYKQQSSDPGFGDGGTSYTYPSFSSLPNADKLYPSDGWTALTNISHTDVDIGNGNLWIVGWAQYILHGFDPLASAGHAAGTACAGVQFAIRVDGQIIAESITGHNGDWLKFIQPLKPEVQRDSNKATRKRTPGPGLYNSRAIRGVGPHAAPVRVTCNVPVTAGVHTVEMVARVVGNARPERFSFSSFASVGVAVHNRKLFVLGCPKVPSSAPARSSTVVPALDAASSISAQAFYTNRVEKLKNAYNDVSEGDLARGALYHEHLPSTILDQSFTQQTNTSSVNYDVLYPGFGDDTIESSSTSGGVGWFWVQDAGSTFLRTDNDIARPAGTDIDVTSQNSYVILMGNVQLRNIANSGKAGRLDQIVAFTLVGQEDSTSNYVNFPAAECYVNRFINWGTAGSGGNAELTLEIDVPIFHVLDYSSSTPAQDWNYIGAVASSIDLDSGSSPAALNFQLVRASLTMIQLRA